MSPILQGEKRAEFVGFVCREGQSKQSHICHIFRAASQAMVSSTIDWLSNPCVFNMLAYMCVVHTSLCTLHVADGVQLAFRVPISYGRLTVCYYFIFFPSLYIQSVLSYFVVRQEASIASESFGN